MYLHAIRNDSLATDDHQRSSTTSSESQSGHDSHRADGEVVLPQPLSRGRMDIDFLNNETDDASCRERGRTVGGVAVAEEADDRSCASILASLHAASAGGAVTASSSVRRREGVDNCSNLLASFHVRSPAAPSSEWGSFSSYASRRHDAVFTSSDSNDTSSPEPTSPLSQGAFSTSSTGSALPSFRDFDEELSRNFQLQRARYPFEPVSPTGPPPVTAPASQGFSASPDGLAPFHRVNSYPLISPPQPLEPAPSNPFQQGRTVSPRLPEFRPPHQMDGRQSYPYPIVRPTRLGLMDPDTGFPLPPDGRRRTDPTPHNEQQLAFRNRRRRLSSVGSGHGVQLGLLTAHRNSSHHQLHARTGPGPLALPPSPTKPAVPHCNIKYADEQLDYVLYWCVDKKVQWKELERMYARHFSIDTSRGIRRTVQGLQGAYYRSNGCIPKADEHGNLIFDENDEVVTIGSLKVRDQTCKIGLLDRYPERAIEYEWVEEEDKQRVWHVGKARQLQLARAQMRKERRRAEAQARMLEATSGSRPDDASPQP